MTNTPPPPAATAGELQKANSTQMVVVGCKLPNGLIIEMGKFGDSGYTQIRLNGSNNARIAGGWGLTSVSKEAWDKWFAKNKNLEFVRKGFVFAHGDEASAEDHTKDMVGTRNGFEALDPMKGLGIKGADGKPLVEVDMSHFNEGKAAIGQLRQAAAR